VLLDGPAVLAPSTATFNGLDRKYTMQAWTEGGCVDIPPQMHFLMCRRTTTRGDSDYSTSVLRHALQAAMLDLASELAVSATRLGNLIGIGTTLGMLGGGRQRLFIGCGCHDIKANQRRIGTGTTWARHAVRQRKRASGLVNYSSPKTHDSF